MHTAGTSKLGRELINILIMNERLTAKVKEVNEKSKISQMMHI